MNLEYFPVWMPVALSAAFSLIGFSIARLSAKPKVNTASKQPVPPEHMDAAAASAVLNNGELQSDTTALLVMDLALDGYLKIRLNDSEQPYDLTLIRIHDYAGMDTSKQRLMDILFADGRNEVSVDDLYDHIDGDMNELTTDICKSDRVQRLFNRTSRLKAKILTTMQITLAICLPLAFWAVHGFPDTGFRTFSICAGTMLIMVLLNSSAMRMTLIPLMLVNGFIAVAFGVVLVPALTKLVGEGELAQPEAIVSYAAVSLALIALRWFRSQIDQYSAEGKQVYQELIKLEHYLLQADNRDVLQQLQTDPDYCYRMLPYAIVMDCPTLWVERLTDLPLPKPAWYDDSAVPFSRETFLNFLSNFGNICYQMTDHSDDSGSSDE